MAKRRTIGDNPQEAQSPEPGEIEVVGPTASTPPVAEDPAPEPSPAPEPMAELEQDDAGATTQAVDAVAPTRPRAAVPEQCLTFQLAGEEYAVGILQIREIVEYETLTKVPSTPAWIRGVMNLRGTVVPVIDLAIKFGLAETEITTRTCVVIIEVDLDGEQTLMGVMVDAVVRVLDLSPEDVEPPPPFGTQVRVDYLLGMGKVDDQLVLVLDADRVLSVDELLAAAAAPAAALAEEDSASNAEGAEGDPADQPAAEPAGDEGGEAPAGDNGDGVEVS